MNWDIIAGLSRDAGGRTLLARQGDRLAVLRQLETEPFWTQPSAPGVVPMREVTELAGRAWAAFDVVRAVSLRAFLLQLAQSRVAPPASLLARVVVDAARALAQVFPRHAHGGLSDTSVLVGLDGRVFVMDHGAPRTNRFSAPTPGPTRDVFALAAVLHSALTGFDGRYGEAGPARSALKLPSQADPSSPAALDELVQRALSRGDETRHPDVAAFADDLERAFAGSLATQGNVAAMVGLALGSRRAALVALLEGQPVTEPTESRDDRTDPDLARLRAQLPRALPLVPPEGPPRLTPIDAPPPPQSPPRLTPIEAAPTPESPPRLTPIDAAPPPPPTAFYDDEEDEPTNVMSLGNLLELARADAVPVVPSAPPVVVGVAEVPPPPPDLTPAHGTDATAPRVSARADEAEPVDPMDDEAETRLHDPQVIAALRASVREASVANAPAGPPVLLPVPVTPSAPRLSAPVATPGARADAPPRLLPAEAPEGLVFPPAAPPPPGEDPTNELKLEQRRQLLTASTEEPARSPPAPAPPPPPSIPVLPAMTPRAPTRTSAPPSASPRRPYLGGDDDVVAVSAEHLVPLYGMKVKKDDEPEGPRAPLPPPPSIETYKVALPKAPPPSKSRIVLAAVLVLLAFGVGYLAAATPQHFDPLRQTLGQKATVAPVPPAVAQQPTDLEQPEDTVTDAAVDDAMQPARKRDAGAGAAASRKRRDAGVQRR